MSLLHINGVSGTYTFMRGPSRIVRQTWVSGTRPCGQGERMRVTIRHDDSCNNGHPSFGVTCDIFDAAGRDVGGGSAHEEIARVFPELAPLIKWHLCSTDGPMHYVANTLFLAGDRDCYGLRAGELRQIRNGRTGALCWQLRIDDGSVQGADTYGPTRATHEGDAPPLDAPRLVWRPWYRVGEGKVRQLDAARRCAVWPEATDAELTAEPDELRAALLARLPALIAQMRVDVHAINFTWE